jgi:transporter family-2 protein
VPPRDAIAPSGRGGVDDRRVRERPASAVSVALVAGACGAVQPKINAVLGTRLGSSLVASLANFAVAFVLVILAIALRPATRRRLVRLRTWPVPRWTPTAGIGGAVVVLAGAVTVETIGVAIFSVAFFAGQIGSGLLVDGLGIAPGGRRPITAARVQAVGLAVGAVVLAQLGRSVGDPAPMFVAFVVVAGGAAAFQSAFNGRIASATGDPVAATAVNVAVGTAALAALVGLLAATGRLGPVHWPTDPWLYSGGALGVTVVFSLAVATAALGVLRATVTMLAAQLIGAFLVDWAVEGGPPTAGVVAGGILIVAAVALVGRRGGRRRTARRRSGTPSSARTSAAELRRR